MRSNSSLVSARRGIVWPHTALAALAGVLAFNACSAGLEEEVDGPPEFAGPIPALAGNQTPTPGPSGNAPTPTGNGTGNASNNGGEQAQGNGTPIAPSTNTGNANGAAGAGNTGNANNGSGGTGGAGMVGTAGSANVGAAGSAMGNAGAGTAPLNPPAQGGEPPVTTPPVTTPPVTTPPVATPPVTTPPVTTPVTPVIDTECPDGAFFCSGFEQTTFPAGTVNIIGGSQFADAFLLDGTQVNSGSQALFLPLTTQSFSYRVMAIPVPVQAFWARMFIRFDTVFGDSGHDALFAVSDSDQTVDNNNETRIEFAEQEGTIVLNRSTDRITFPISRPATLTANTWHCVEARFDGRAGDVEIFADGQAIISALGNAQFQFNFQTFRIGTLQFHDPRNVWFDDVVLDTERVGCN